MLQRENKRSSDHHPASVHGLFWRISPQDLLKPRSPINVHGLGSNYTLKAGKLALNIEDVWELFAKHSAQLHADMKLLELLENGEPKEKTTEFLSVVSSWQGNRDSNPE